MKRLIFVMLALLVSACGSQTAPTPDAISIQASAVAMVSTMAAQTQAAIPTLTPTDTPRPTATPSPSPTASPTLGTQVPSNATADPCNHPLWGGPVGAPDAGKMKATNILIVNNTRVSITISFYLVKNANGQCGYTSYVVGKGQSTFLANVLPNGCYYAHAFIDDPKKPTQVSSGPDCLTGQDKTTYTVSMDKLKVVGP